MFEEGREISPFVRFCLKTIQITLQMEGRILGLCMRLLTTPLRSPKIIRGWGNFYTAQFLDPLAQNLKRDRNWDRARQLECLDQTLTFSKA